MIRLGLSSAGVFVERGVLPRLQDVENVKVAAISDPFQPDRANTLAETFGIELKFDGFQAMIESDAIDAVYICAPNCFHHDLVIAAAQAGKHVLCEKPLSLNAAEGEGMVQACEKHGVKFGIGFCYPHAGPQKKVKQLLDQGTIGDLSHIHLSFNLVSFTKDVAGWRCDPKISGGGPLMDLAPHLVHLACFMADDKVESVMAYVEPPMDENQIETDALVILRFSQGIHATLETSFIRSKTHSYCLTGDKGNIHAEGTMAWQVGGRIILEEDFKTRDVDFDQLEGIEQEFREFANAIEQDSDLVCDGRIGLHVQTVIDAIYESGRTGKRCSCQESN